MKEKNNDSHKRDLTIDVAKGIGIFLVVLAHTIKNEFVHNVIYMFHMPLFFLLAGMTLKYSLKNDTKDFLIKKIKKVIVPYLFFCIVTFLYWAIIERKIRGQMDISVVGNFINIFLFRINGDLYSYNIAMWFLPCLFISELLVYYLMKRVKSNKFRFMVSLIIFVLGYVMAINKVYLVFAIETAFIAQFFIFVGYYFSTVKNKVNILAKVIAIILSICTVIISLLLDNNIAMLGHNYGNIFIFVTSAIGGSYVVYELSSLIKNSKVLQFIGLNSLIILGFHEPIKRIVIKLFATILKVSDTFIRNNIFYSIVITIIVLIIIVPGIFILNRYFPMLVGRSRRIVDEK